MSVRLRMHQAYQGDFLTLAAGTERAVLDAGTSACAAEFKRELDRGPRLLVITHLDEDHFGGLHELLQGGGPLRLPQEIWLNHFEAEEVAGAVMAAVGGDEGPANQSPWKLCARALRQAVQDGQEWSASTKLIVAEEAFPNVNADVVVGCDPDVADYLAGYTRNRESPALAFAPDDVKTLHMLLHELAHLPFRDLERWRSELGSLLSVRDRALLHRFCVSIMDALDSPESVPPSPIGRVVIRPGGRGDLHLWLAPAGPVSAAHVRSWLETGGNPPHLPESILGVAHLAQNGPVLAREALRTTDSLTLIEAIHRASPTTRIRPAKAGDVTRLGQALRLEVLGPDEPELALLRRHWRRVREKGRVHHGFARMMLFEATLVASFTFPYDPDQSETNRSSIQVLAEGATHYAVLTGDGRPDTLERWLSRAALPAKPCRVFKAAHHGGHRNIRVDQLKNKLLSVLKPAMIWVSAGDSRHPSREFLQYLFGQRSVASHRIRLTNANAHADQLRMRRGGKRYLGVFAQGTHTTL